MNSNQFIFDDNYGGDQAALTIVVPKNIVKKDELLSYLADQLYFPSYFGFNWDAFEEVMNDLSWIKQDEIVIFHEEIPLVEEHDRRSYLRILSDVIEKCKREKGPRLNAIFRNSDKEKIAKVKIN